MGDKPISKRLTVEMFMVCARCGKAKDKHYIKKYCYRDGELSGSDNELEFTASVPAQSPVSDTSSATDSAKDTDSHGN